MPTWAKTMSYAQTLCNGDKFVDHLKRWLICMSSQSVRNSCEKFYVWCGENKLFDRFQENICIFPSFSLLSSSSSCSKRNYTCFVSPFLLLSYREPCFTCLTYRNRQNVFMNGILSGFDMLCFSVLRYKHSMARREWTCTQTQVCVQNVTKTKGIYVG